MQGIDTLALRCYQQLSEVESSWQQLERRGAAPTVYQSWQWVSAWQRRLGGAPSSRLAIVVVSAADETPLALLPFMIRRDKGLRVLRWLGDSHFNYPGGLFVPRFLSSLDEGRFRALWRRIDSVLPGYDVVWLDSQLPRLGDAPSPWQWLDRRPAPNSAHRLVFEHHDWSRLLPELRGKKTRKRMRNEESRLSREGMVTFQTVEDAAQLPAALDALFAQRHARFRSLGIPVEDRVEDYRDFYLDLLQASAAGGEGIDRYYLLRLNLDGEMLAGLLVAEKDRIAYPLINSMTLSRYSRWSPGDYLLRYLIRDACERQLTAIDFGLAEDSNYKTAWCNWRAETYETIHGRTLRGMAAARLITMRTATARRIKQSPRAFAWYRYIRALKTEGLRNHDWKDDFQRLFRAAGG